MQSCSPFQEARFTDTPFSVSFGGIALLHHFVPPKSPLCDMLIVMATCPGLQSMHPGSMGSFLFKLCNLYPGLSFKPPEKNVSAVARSFITPASMSTHEAYKEQSHVGNIFPVFNWLGADLAARVTNPAGAYFKFAARICCFINSEVFAFSTGAMPLWDYEYNAQEAVRISIIVLP